MQIINWLTDAEANDDKYKRIIITGMKFKYGQRWGNYLKLWMLNHRPKVELLRQYILDNKIHILNKEFKETNPLFDDDFVLMFSFAGWGDLLAATWAEAENRDYNYTLFVEW